ncbi:hypothetical protein [Labilibaculum antarcticum]|uniref:VacJ n=1 Tax=Labilibaculum antarcticum TaxID=1717717 RepID=A0A1Y1CKD2_9BACT|nr:hypothetical protein [Labilibaculum antarcticum]BAX80849.1 hypothetical protein ALGA_2527 [Labilibaculum antarcticum]
MFETVNRNALIVRPKQALLNWVNSIFPEDPISLDALGKHDNANVYLIPEMNYTEESLQYLKDNFEPILEEILFDWCQDDELWPKNRNWKMFEEYLDYSIQSVVIDVANGKIEKEEF